MNAQSLARYAFFANFATLTLHEMNAITWKEWRIFGIMDDASGERIFILAHFPLYAALLSLCTRLDTRIGKVVSTATSAFLVLHLLLHYNARSRGYFTDRFGFGLVVVLAATALAQLLGTLAVIREAGRARYPARLGEDCRSSRS
jgi:hypothetical protein